MSGSSERARITFVDFDRTLEVDDGTSLLAAARGEGVPLGSHCGGVCACSKCHVYVDAGMAGLSAPEDDELDMLELAAQERDDERSRLACQARVQAGADVLVRLSEESFRQWLDDHPPGGDEALRRWLRRPR